MSLLSFLDHLAGYNKPYKVTCKYFFIIHTNYKYFLTFRRSAPVLWRIPR